jgi:hypothetical protein
LRLLPNGSIFSPKVGWDDGILTLRAHAGVLTFHGEHEATWHDVANPAESHEEGSSSLHIDDRVSPPRALLRVYGGGARDYLGAFPGGETDVVEEIDLTGDAQDAAWRSLAPMHHPRTNVTTVNLPGGEVLAVGGQVGGAWNPHNHPVLVPEIYDPDADTWTVLAPMQVGRQYHSTAVLLPDGRVFVTGGQDPASGGQFFGGADRDFRNYEIYSPPYMFKARPVIEDFPESIRYGEEFSLRVTGGVAPVDSVVFITPSSVTHHTDTGRFIEVAIDAVEADDVRVRAPSTAAVAPPGYYMVFAVADGVPTVAEFIRIVPPPSG